MHKVYAGGCSFNKICTRKKNGATTQLVPSCLKTCLYVFLSNKRLLVRHANIVQRVKSCYKIKINSGESKSCFYVFFQHKSHPQ